MARAHPRHPEEGIGLLEVILTVTIFGILALAVGVSADNVRRMSSAVRARENLQTAADRAIRRIVDDLRRSGFTTRAGIDFPYLFDDGVAAPDYSVHAHPAADRRSKAGEPDFGPNREIVFLLPADANADGMPDLDVDGNVVWEAGEFAYVVVTREDGTNELQLTVEGQTVERIAPHVERIVFDDDVTSGFQVPMNAIRVRIFFRRTDASGQTFLHRAEALVELRNAAN